MFIRMKAVGDTTDAGSNSPAKSQPSPGDAQSSHDGSFGETSDNLGLK